MYLIADKFDERKVTMHINAVLYIHANDADDVFDHEFNISIVIMMDLVPS